MRISGLAAVALAVFAIGHPAVAALVTRTYDFTASGFGAGAPQASVSGDFTVTYDPLVEGNPSGIPPSAIDLAIAGHTYTTADTIFAAGPNFVPTFNLAGTPGGFALVPGANDFGLGFDGIPDGPFTNEFFGYTTVGTPNEIFLVTDVTVSLAAVPEPGSLALFGTALSGFAFLRRRRRRENA